jgi:apolipoprotein N-acyltransferase
MNPRPDAAPLAPPRPSRRVDVVRALAALASGVVLMFVSPPYGLHWLHWASFVPLFVALDAESPKRSFRLGYLSGAAAVFALFFWLTDTITTFSNLPLPLAAAILLLFAGVWGLPYGFLAAVVHPIR